MDKLPSEIVNDPLPLVVVLGSVEGEPDLHIRLIRSFEQIGVDNDYPELPPIRYKHLIANHSFPEKKPIKDIPVFDGIFKSNWLNKHHQLLPSVVLFTTTFCIDWSSSEWARREATLQETYLSLKSSLSYREAKVIIVAIKTGIGSVDKDVMDDRIISLKRHLQLDSKSFVLLSNNEINSQSPQLKRVNKSIREHASYYYSSLTRKVRIIDTNISRGIYDSLLTARYAFKTAQFNEFQGHKVQASKCYRQCCQTLIECLYNIDEDYMDQVKILADYANFKLCNNMLKNNMVKEAYVQFKSFVSIFMKAGNLYPWRHYAWLSDQYLLFAQLLEKYNITEGFEADKSYYYENAAKFQSKRQESWLSHLQKKSNANNINTKAPGEILKDIMDNNYKGMVLSAAVYVGGFPQLIDPVLDQNIPKDGDIEKVYELYLEDMEVKIEHGKQVTSLLKLAHDAIDPLHRRRRAQIRNLLAEQYMIEGNYDIAMMNLTPAIELLSSEGWSDAVIPILSKKINCAIFLGRPREYIVAALMLYSLTCGNPMKTNETKQIHADIMSVLGNSSEDVNTRLPQGNNFGKYATTDQPPEYEVPHGYVIDMSIASKMFEIQVSFSTPAVQMGQSVEVTLSITSKFEGTMNFAKMVVHFTGDAIVQTFLHSNSTNDDSSSSVNIDNSLLASLVFEYNKPTLFKFNCVISESCLNSFVTQDSFMGIEKIQFVLAFKNRAVSSIEDDIIDRTNNSTSACEVIFDVSVLSPNFNKSKEGTGKSMTLKELVQFVEVEQRPALLQIAKPTPLITLKDPISDVVMLQGPVQRLNVIFQCGSNDLRNGRVYLSSDSNPESTSSALFWYPDFSNVSPSSLIDSSALDKVCFHPLMLNSSMQPLQPILLPDQDADSEFCVPLFLRSEVHGSFKVKLCIEYVPKSGLTLPVTKDFEINVTFDRPVKMSYSMTPQNDAQCGVIRENNASLVMRGDIINMAASLTCINGLNGNIELLGMSLHTKPEDDEQINNSSEQSASTVIEIFKSVNGDSICDLLGGLSDSDNAEVVRLQKGEVFVGSTCIYCSECGSTKDGVDLNLVPSMDISETVNASMGNLYVDWRIADDTLFLPYKSASSSSSIIGSKDFDWLHKLGSRNLTESALDLEVVSTRVCGMVFVVPQVQVVNPPFNVKFNIPTLCKLGETISIDIEIKNKMWSYERLNMIIEQSDDFIMTGALSGCIDLLPQAVETFRFSITPIKCGQILVPHFNITWTNKVNNKEANVIDVGSKTTPLFIFVKP